MRRHCLLCALTCLVAVSAARGDTVLLANGNRFDDVIATVAPGGAVTIRFSYGEIELPPDMILRVEKAESGLAAYLAEFESLEVDRGATAADWLDLAVSARAAGLDDGYRRAARRAADLDPTWPELASHMRVMDFVFDSKRGLWVSLAEVRAAERSAQRQVVAETAAPSRTLERERLRLLDALELFALAELAEELNERRPEPRPTAPVYVVPTIGFARPFHAGSGWPNTEHNRRTMQELIRRQPGSLLPVLPRHHSHSRASVTGKH